MAQVKRPCHLLLILFCLSESSLFGAELWPGFVACGYNDEQVREIRFAEDARAIIVAPAASE
jgi:hypothetical protein